MSLNRPENTSRKVKNSPLLGIAFRASLALGILGVGAACSPKPYSGEQSAFSPRATATPEIALASNTSVTSEEAPVEMPRIPLTDATYFGPNQCDDPSALEASLRINPLYGYKNPTDVRVVEISTYAKEIAKGQSPFRRMSYINPATGAVEQMTAVVSKEPTNLLTSNRINENEQVAVISLAPKVSLLDRILGVSIAHAGTDNSIRCVCANPEQSAPAPLPTPRPYIPPVVTPTQVVEKPTPIVVVIPSKPNITQINQQTVVVRVEQPATPTPVENNNDNKDNDNDDNENDNKRKKPTKTPTPVTPTVTGTPVTPTVTKTPETPTITPTGTVPTVTNTPQTPTVTGTPVTPTVTNTPVTPTITNTPETPVTLTATPTAPRATITPQPKHETATPGVGPTQTPVTTATRIPTHTPVTPVVTREATPTAPRATITPQPKHETATPVPANTKLPTQTPQPVATRVPTLTPKPEQKPNGQPTVTPRATTAPSNKN